MLTFVMLTRLNPEAVRSPKVLEDLERQVMERVRKECPDVEWVNSYAILVARFSQIDGYRCLSLIRASVVVNCQSALAWLAFRSSSQAAISSMRVCLSGMRRSRH